jgi:hypothetical protein
MRARLSSNSAKSNELSLNARSDVTFGPAEAPLLSFTMDEASPKGAATIQKEKDMERKLFDVLASLVGVGMVVVLAVAGGLLMWGYSFANSNVHNQLAEQQITFPSAAAFAHPAPGTEITPSMVGTVSKYAGQPLTTGTQAEVYANDFIAVHLAQIGGGKTYAQLSAAAMALPKGSPAYTAAEGKVQTVFQGTTLRGLLLEAYAFGTFATIALIAAISAFVLAGLMAIMVAFGFWHARRTDEAEELEVQTSHANAKGLVPA